MLEKYLPEDICEIIRNKLSLDYMKYRFWCNTEGRWIYLWTEYKLTKITDIKCPNEKSHDIYLEFIRITNKIKADGRILKIDRTKELSCNITQTDFEIIKV